MSNNGWGQAFDWQDKPNTWSIKVILNQMLLIHVCHESAGSTEMMSHDSMCSDFEENGIKNMNKTMRVRCKALLHG